MRRVQIALWCIALVIVLGGGSLSSKGFSETGIVVSPENPTELDTLEVTITAGCCRMPVSILDTTVAVSEGLIMVVADRECGPFTMATIYTHTVVVPPVEPGSYVIEYWVTGDCLIQPNPILVSEINVLPFQVPVSEKNWGAIKLLHK
ncbi:MAG: hypothetical protein JSV33_15010 [bacterium]|nr:MAG: hypothetical protein JSV33_15010 [bacterium]